MRRRGSSPQSGLADYVRVGGRIDAEDSFEDADHRPLVFRRTRFVARSGRGWTPFEDSREAVPFEIHEGLDAIGIDSAALDDGLVVVARESRASPATSANGRPPTWTPRRRSGRSSSRSRRSTTRSSSACRRRAARAAPITMTAGLGRPLILTTLETDEAMRILAGGANRPRFVAACLVAGAALIVAGLAWAGVGAIGDAIAIVGRAIVPVALAASPSPAVGGDPRSSGEGPGLVGEPGIAILVVAVIAITSILVTTAWIRLTDDRSAEERRSANARRSR